MDMDTEDIVDPSSHFQDWELLLPQSDTAASPALDASFHEIALLEPNYFSLDARKPYASAAAAAAADPDDDKSAASDNPSWIDPVLDDNPTRYLHKDPGGFWSDSSSDRSQDRKFTDLDGRSEMDSSENDAKGARPGGIGEILEETVENVEGLGIPPDSTGCGEANAFAENNNSHVDGQPEVLGEEKNENDEVANGAGNKKASDLGKRSVVWWKMPMEILKCCVFKMSPVWAISLAAAVMGFVILRRRLYKIKKKTRALEIKLTVGDKNISQAMSHANRLNDAFSIVKRVPMIRPSLPAVGTTATWPVASLR